jgi:hypothetical protein
LPVVGTDVWDVDVLKERHEEMLEILREDWAEREKRRYESLYGEWLGGMVEQLSVDDLVSAVLALCLAWLTCFQKYFLILSLAQKTKGVQMGEELGQVRREMMSMIPRI